MNCIKRASHLMRFARSNTWFDLSQVAWKRYADARRRGDLVLMQRARRQHTFACRRYRALRLDALAIQP